MGTRSKKITDKSGPLLKRGRPSQEQVLRALRVATKAVFGNRSDRRYAHTIIRREMKHILKKDTGDWTELEEATIKQFHKLLRSNKLWTPKLQQDQNEQLTVDSPLPSPKTVKGPGFLS